MAMNYITRVLALALFLSVALGQVVGRSIVRHNTEQTTRKTCRKPLVRKEWRTLSKSQQLSYLSAVQCFLAKPARTLPTIAPGAVSRYDDMIATHIQQTFSIHYTGHFLPWHRYFVAVYEKALRTECNYTGAQPYWDWTLDVGSTSAYYASPVFHPKYGFGGNGPYVAGNDSNPFAVPGRTGGGCVGDGPFQNMTVRLGPQSSLEASPRCLHRDFSPYFAGRYLGLNQTQLTLSQGDYGWFARFVEGGPSFDASGIHGGGHYGVGGTYGEMGDLYASPSDPIFYLHHANLDRVWWSWQAKNLSSRLWDISGPIYLMDYDNLQGGNVTLDFPISVGVNGPNVTVRDLMDIEGEKLCYTYDKVYSQNYVKSE